MSVNNSQKNILQGAITAINTFFKQVNVPASILQESLNLEIFDLSCDIPSKVKDLISSLQVCLKTEKNDENVTPDLIQITASKEELDKRISAFIAHSQQAVDEQNVQEFCQNSLITKSCPEESCARTDALYKRRPANITHMQVSRVYNEEGPQTNVNNQGQWIPSRHKIKTEVKPQHSFKQVDCPPGLMERLDNLQDHLKINSITAPKDIYERLKEMEKRVLHLESISPEYFSMQKMKYEKSRSRSHSLEDSPNFELNEIDDRIRYLKRKLLKKS